MKVTVLFATVLAVMGMFADVAPGAASLEEGFHNPPSSAKPHTWYHMMNGNVTKAGITCDFEALAKAGIGDDILYPDDCEWKGEVKDGVKEIGIKEIPKWVKEGNRSPTGRHTFTTWKHWDKNDKLLPSGLLGPVRLCMIDCVDE